MFSDCQAVFFDLCGVLYEGDSVYPGAVDAVQAALRQGKVVRYVTNTATRSETDICDKLLRLGFPVEDGQLYAAPRAARDYVAARNLRPLCLVHPAILGYFEGLATEDEPNCVVLGDAREGLHYDALNHAFRVCMNGAPLIGIGRNKYFKDAGQLMLDAGAFIAALEWATGVEAVIMGKPSEDFFLQIVHSTGHEPKDCLMIGDDVNGDIVGAVNAGLQGCLVRTGKYRSSDDDTLPVSARIVDSIADCMN
ncbi:TIGR01458 family HAD-type hydrolase [Cerasicoccus maritimus]|uniref:TIGR01458 family HAD-type hydrolase n=1 Tax=Cerasicoccus maritimus TaxID=490089 RepID=UPI0028525849|nr:TIGR01458 family HAD-type hydrolase [Cerasicoccus maritimus]